MLLFIESAILGFAVFLLYTSIFVLKRIPKGLVEWGIWIAAVVIIVSWIVGG